MHSSVGAADLDVSVLLQSQSPANRLTLGPNPSHGGRITVLSARDQMYWNQAAVAGQNRTPSPKGSLVGERQRVLSLSWLAPLAANLAWRSAVDFSKDGVEASQAPESCLHRDLGHRQASFVEQAFSSLHACGLCHF